MSHFFGRWEQFQLDVLSDVMRLPMIQFSSSQRRSVTRQATASSTRFSWGKGGKVSAVGWQVTLCDLTWHVISRSGVVKFTNCYILFTLLIFYRVTDPHIRVNETKPIHLHGSHFSRRKKHTGHKNNTSKARLSRLYWTTFSKFPARFENKFAMSL